MTKKKLRTVLLAVYDYLLFFMLFAFIISCTMILFLRLLVMNSDFTWTEESLQVAAKFTFFNVIFLSFTFTTIDKIRKKLIVDSHMNRITAAAEKMMNGDFSVRIKPINAMMDRNNFNAVIECFNRMAEELQGTETLRTDFISNVSHELKTPLTVMSNYAALLSQPSLPDEQRLHYANAINDSTQKMATLVNDILRLNKLENQTFMYNNERFDLSEQLCECLLPFAELCEEKKLQLHADIAPDIRIISDRELLEIVWNNLISNAVKFTPSGGTVSVALQQNKDKVTVTVADTGCGISPLTGKHIFDKFYQGDTSHAAEGNGLGLALVRRIIDLTGAEISVRSEENKGSTFIVDLRITPF